MLSRARRDLPTCAYPNPCAAHVQRTVWDGDQILAEQRTSGLDGITGGAPDHGTVRYVHPLGIDAPVAVLDSRFPGARVLHYNWRGLAEASSWADGTGADAEVGGSTVIAWPAGQGVYFKRQNQPEPPDPTWIGSLPANGAGATGLLYRRNRYYDPASGRFTQEDPIGLAGGLNLYGFAGGDPVNFSDPFGLCKVELKANRVARVTDFRHAYVVTTEPDNTRTVFRGGPGERHEHESTTQGDDDQAGDNQSSQGRHRPIRAEAARYKKGSVDYRRNAPSTTLVDNDEPCDKYQASFRATVNAINDADLTYSEIGTNSNSVAYQLLVSAGITPPQQIGTLVINRRLFPGWGLRLLP